MTVYVDIAGTKVGDPVAIELKRGDAKLSVPGKIATDEMSGFLFATLPDDGRSKAMAEFAKSCSLD
jgi:hypothetical protein